jgi:hypothetical protein
MPTHEQKIAKLKREVGMPRLIAAIGLVIQQRRKRAGKDWEDFSLSEELRPNETPEQMVDRFLSETSTQQLKMLREIAKGLRLDDARPVSDHKALMHAFVPKTATHCRFDDHDQ